MVTITSMTNHVSQYGHRVEAQGRERMGLSPLVLQQGKIDRVVIINDHSSEVGGAEIIALTSALWLHNRNLPVTVLAGDAGHNVKLSAQGIDVLGMGQRAVIDVPTHVGVVRGTYNRQTATFIADWIARNDTRRTIYHLHQWAHILSPSVFRALRGVVDRLVITAHDYFLVCPNGAFMDYPHDVVCRRVPLSVSCLVVNCDRRKYSHKVWRVARQVARNAMIDLGSINVPITVLHPGMVPEFIRGGTRSANLRVLRNPVQALSRERIRAEINHEFVFVGRVGIEKGADLACRAAREAGVPLRIIGDGPIRSELQRTYPEFTFSGWCSREMLTSLAKRARALIMPSRYPEPFGLVAVEALWAGVPVVVTDRALLAPEIEASESGVSFDAQDIRALVAALDRLARDDGLVARMSERAFASTGWMATTPETWTDALLCLYRERLCEDRNKLSPADADGPREYSSGVWRSLSRGGSRDRGQRS
jgi:glycosyltransferase involved in cell wall biosynthesis